MQKRVRNKDTCNVVCFNKQLVLKLKSMIPAGFHIEEVAEMFSLLGDKTRIKIVFALSKEKELCVCDIANVLGLTISATSHQLRKLKDKKVVKYRNDRNMVYYFLVDRYIENLLSDVFKHLEKMEYKK